MTSYNYNPHDRLEHASFPYRPKRSRPLPPPPVLPASVLVPEYRGSYVWTRLASGDLYGVPLNPIGRTVTIPSRPLIRIQKHNPLGAGTINGEDAQRRTVAKPKPEYDQWVNIHKGRGFKAHRRPTWRTEGNKLNDWHGWDRGNPSLFDQCNRIAKQSRVAPARQPIAYVI